MAEIHIERRPRPRLLPWLIGLVVLAVLVYLVARTVGPWSAPPEPDAVEQMGHNVPAFAPAWRAS